MKNKIKGEFCVIINEELIALDEKVDELLANIVHSDTFHQYIKAQEALNCDNDLQKDILDFQHKKAHFEEIERFGAYMPEFKQIRRELQRTKRKMDMQPQMIAYRQSETALQGILDEICLEMSTVISDDIKVDAGNPFFIRQNHQGCGGSCHV